MNFCKTVSRWPAIPAHEISYNCTEKAQKEIKEKKRRKKKRASSFLWFQKEVLLYIIKVLDD